MTPLRPDGGQTPAGWVCAASRDDGQPDTTRPTGPQASRSAPPDDGPDPLDFGDIPPDEDDD